MHCTFFLPLQLGHGVIEPSAFVKSVPPQKEHVTIPVPLQQSHTPAPSSTVRNDFGRRSHSGRDPGPLRPKPGSQTSAQVALDRMVFFGFFAGFGFSSSVFMQMNGPVVRWLVIGSGAPATKATLSFMLSEVRKTSAYAGRRKLNSTRRASRGVVRPKALCFACAHICFTISPRNLDRFG